MYICRLSVSVWYFLNALWFGRLETSSHFPITSYIFVTKALKPSDVFLDVNGKTFEATILINDWVYELNIGKIKA